MYTLRKYLCIAVAALLVQHTSSKPMSLRRAAATRASTTRRIAPSTKSRSWGQWARSFVTSSKESPVATPPQKIQAAQQEPKTSWSAWFTGLFKGSPTPSTSTFRQPINTDFYIPITSEQQHITEQSKINDFKEAMIKAPPLADYGSYDSNNMETIKNREALIEKNPEYINLPIAFKDSFRVKGNPRHTITFLHQLLRVLITGWYAERKHMLIEQYELMHRKPDVWHAEIALIKKILTLGGRLGDNPQEALFEILKRKAVIQNLYPTIYEQYFKNNINNLLKEIAEAHNRPYA